jgi:hypothetical protein
MWIQILVGQASLSTWICKKSDGGKSLMDGFLSGQGIARGLRLKNHQAHVWMRVSAGNGLRMREIAVCSVKPYFLI